MKKEIKKKYYDVKVEASVPAVLHFKILAENPEEALKLIKNKSPNGIQYKLIQRKNIKATVYDAGTLLIRLVEKVFK